MIEEVFFECFYKWYDMVVFILYMVGMLGDEKVVVVLVDVFILMGFEVEV